MKQESSRNLNVIHEDSCPFCGGRFMVCDPPAVGHSDPACDTFIRLDVTDYVAAVNRAQRQRMT